MLIFDKRFGIYAIDIKVKVWVFCVPDTAWTSWLGFTKCWTGMARGQYLASSKAWQSCYYYCFIIPQVAKILRVKNYYDCHHHYKTKSSATAKKTGHQLHAYCWSPEIHPISITKTHVTKSTFGMIRSYCFSQRLYDYTIEKLIDRLKYRDFNG